MEALQFNSKKPSVNAQFRIRCQGSRILVGDNEFLSATEALETYISQYEGSGLLADKRRYHRTATDLLNPKTALHLTAERSLQTGVRGTEQEMDLADVKDGISESMLQMKKNVKLQAEVEEALNKSQELMDNINQDDFPNQVDCPSDVGSLNTETLVTMNPTDGYRGPAQSKSQAPSWKSKHVFSYRTQRNRRAKTLGSLDIGKDLQTLLGDQAAQSTKRNKNANSPLHVTFQDNSSITSPAKEMVGFDDDVSVLLSDTSPTQKRSTARGSHRDRERSRSVSPSILKRERKLFESGVRSRPLPSDFHDFDASVNKTPSWVETMDLSDVTDSAWRQRDFTASRPPPSWVQDMDGSGITSVGPSKPAKPLQLQDLLRPLPVFTNNQDSSINSDNNDTLPPPGLSFRDLVGDTSKLRNTQPPRPPQDGATPSLSTKLQDLQTKTTAALDRYHERMQQQDFGSPSIGSNLGSTDNVPRCSSLDTAALLAGGVAPSKSDITGASPIAPDVTALSSPDKRRPRSPDTDVVLEGDRPWEKTSYYKSPVKVTNGQQTHESEGANFSGGSQPGSLEALKNMIFKLQQEASMTESDEEHSKSLSMRVQKLRKEAADMGIGVGPKEKMTEDIPSLKGYNFQAEPGGQSLEKALVHLDRLKTLVQKTQEQKDQGDAQSGTMSPSKPLPLCANMDSGNLQ